MSSQLGFSSRGKFSEKTSATLGCLSTFSSRHVLNLRDDRLESRGEKQGQEGKCDECSPELPCRRQRPAVEGTVDIEEVIVSQGEEVAHTVEHGMHRHGWKRHSADAKREDAPE